MNWFNYLFNEHYSYLNFGGHFISINVLLLQVGDLRNEGDDCLKDTR